MRESIGSTWILQLVVVFILLFVSFLTLTLAYTKSYKVKNEVLNIIEKYEGLTTNAVSIINQYLEYNGYNTKGKCPDSTWYGVSDLNQNNVGDSDKAGTNTKYYYCVKKINTNNDNYHYYEIITFFNFNLPIVGDFATFKIEGSTTDVKKSVDDLDSFIG